MSAPGVGTPSHEVFRCFDISGEQISLYVHPEEWCIDENKSFCTIHNPRDWPLAHNKHLWDAYKGRMLRECGHGVFHSDPDDIRTGETCTEMDCDKCCQAFLEGDWYDQRPEICSAEVGPDPSGTGDLYPSLEDCGPGAGQEICEGELPNTECVPYPGYEDTHDNQVVGGK
jgi:hypothetical protein